MLLIPALNSQEDLCEVKASLFHRASFRTTRAINTKPVLTNEGGNVCLPITLSLYVYCINDPVHVKDHIKVNVFLTDFRNQGKLSFMTLKL